MWLLGGSPLGRPRAGRWALRCGLARRLPQVREEREVTREHAEREEQVEGAVSQPYLRVEEEELGREEDRQNKGFPERHAEADEDGDREQGLRRCEVDLLRLAGVEVEGRKGAAGDRVGERQAADEERPLVDLGGDEYRHGGAVAAAGGHHARQDELRRFRRPRRPPPGEEGL